MKEGMMNIIINNIMIDELKLLGSEELIFIRLNSLLGP